MNHSSTSALLSQKYIEILATMNGHQAIAKSATPSSVRIRETVERKLPKGKRAMVFTNREIKGYVLPVAENQIRQSKSALKISIDPIIYNAIAETSQHQIPTVLFICAWPADEKGAVIFSREAMSMICTCYWFIPERNETVSASGKDFSVEIPHEQFLDEEAFAKIFEKIFA